jgi:hypothetical protein
MTSPHIELPAGRDLVALGSVPSTEVRSFLTLSTGHVSEATDQWLRLAAAKSIAWVSATPSGWFFWANDPAAGGIYPADLLVCIRHAERQGCEFIMFDSEADPLEELPFFISRDGRWLNTPVK